MADIELLNIAKREFKLLYSLEHPNVIKVKDMFYNEAFERAYMVMEYNEG